jgi:cytidylate kinase
MAARARPIVALDGPAGAGKSTVSRKLAEVLGFVLVDTGAMYRAVALEAQRRGVAWIDAAALGELALAIVREKRLRFERDPGGGVCVLLSGEDVSQAIRAPDVAMGASQVSAHGEVRGALLDLQRQAGAGGGVVLEGRDIGTVVFPDAEAKFFLTARPEVRARRRYEELVAKGQRVTFEETLADVTQRDAQDETRTQAPLRKAEDAVLVDSSDTTIDKVVALMAERVRALASRLR